MLSKGLGSIFGLIILVISGGTAFGEVVYLNNGDVIHGSLVSANNTELKLETPYGTLPIPKKDVQRIDYHVGAPAPGTESGAETDKPSGPPPPPDIAGKTAMTVVIRGNSFWYAFESGEGVEADTRIRLRVFLGETRACALVDGKPDTVDGKTLYNSFTFTASDALVVE